MSTEYPPGWPPGFEAEATAAAAIWPPNHVAPDADTHAPPMRQRRLRPPAAITAKNVAAAVRLGVQSAGLSWLQQAAASDAARSNAPPADTGAAPPARETPSRAEEDVPLIGEPPRHDREVTLPVPDGFVWPTFAFCAFYEHSGEKREANAHVLGAPTCSVADRRTILPPSGQAWHFIGSVQSFVATYPHPIRRQSNHVTCGGGNWASWTTHPQKIRDGTMRRAAEELLWINCIGDRSTGEQPPSAHQHTVGPPTVVLNGNQFGAPDKTYCTWLRNLPPVPPTDPVPPAARWSELTVSGSVEAKTVKRSYTPRNLALAEARAHANVSGGDTSEFGRPAHQPCRGYKTWRRQLAHNFSLLAAHYAPTVNGAWLQLATRPSALIMVPIAQSHLGTCAMVHILEPDCVFGAPRDTNRGGAEQGEEIAAFISEGIETQYASPLRAYGHEDSVIIVPWSTTPVTVISTPAERGEARAAGLSAAWCTLGALDGHAAYQHVGLALGRLAALTTVGAHGAQCAGVWATARPLVHMRTARAWADADDQRSVVNRRERAEFFAAEAARGHELRTCLAAADDGDGTMIAFADSIRTAADYEGELPFPRNGLPDYSSPTLRLLPMVERPLSLDTSWLARLPPQQVPPGFEPLPWQGIIRGWGRRLICESLNATANRDFQCWEHGASTLQRPKYVALGQGAGRQIPHADGIGTYNALSIVYELDEATGLYDKLDYTREGRTHWVLNVLRQVFGEHDDGYLMSLVMHGVRWGIAAPMQIRIAANLERLDTRIRGVGAAFRKLLKKGLYYKFKKLRRANETISPDGPGPFIILPPYVVGTGGTDKPDKPDEKRIVGDQGNPHPEQGVRERNQPHGEPTGPEIVSMNDMMGPAPGTVPRGQLLDATRYPMPERESKPRPKHVYRDEAILSHMAHVNGSYKAGFKDDGSNMFFQFEMSPEEERTCCFLVLMELPVVDDDGTPLCDENGEEVLELWCVLIVCTCMNMGSRNASKIAQRFTDRLLEGFAQHLDVYVRETWLHKQKPELIALIAERSAKLGHRQSRPFATSGYTDDFKYTCLGAELLVAGIVIWRMMCKRANFWLSDKAGAGTVFDYIGGRLVLNGGYGCLPPSKHARAIADTVAAIEGRSTREELESSNSFLVHVHDWLDFPKGTLKGISAPLKVPGHAEQLAVVEGHVLDQFNTILGRLHTRNAASFWSGVDDTEDGSAGFNGLTFAPRLMSDSCSDVAAPHICGMAGGLYFRFPLEGAWRRRHITLTEACGTSLCLIILPPYFPNLELLVESDATASLAAAEATAAAPDLLYMRRRAAQVPTFAEATLRAWLTHCKGWANGLTDTGSRDKINVMYDVAAAFGMRLREVPIPPEAHAFMRDVLANTTDVEPRGVLHSTSLGLHNLNMIGDMPVAEGGAAADTVGNEAGVGSQDWWFRPITGDPVLTVAEDWALRTVGTLRDTGDEQQWRLVLTNHGRWLERARYEEGRDSPALSDAPDAANEAGGPEPESDGPDSDSDMDEVDEAIGFCITCGATEWCDCAYEAARAPTPPTRPASRAMAHSTSLGTHNLNMIGDMPVAEGALAVLVEQLDAATADGASPTTIARIAGEIATRCGVRPKSATVRAIQAACWRIRRPALDATDRAAAARFGASRARCCEWRSTIKTHMSFDDVVVDDSGDGSAAGPSSSAQPSTAAACNAAAETLALLAGEATAPQPPTGPPPPSAPPSPPTLTPPSPPPLTRRTTSRPPTRWRAGLRRSPARRCCTGSTRPRQPDRRAPKPDASRRGEHRLSRPRRWRVQRATACSPRWSAALARSAATASTATAPRFSRPRQCHSTDVQRRKRASGRARPGRRRLRRQAAPRVCHRQCQRPRSHGNHNR